MLVLSVQPRSCLPPRLPCRAAPQGGCERDAAVAVHPGLVNTALAAGYFKQMPPKLLRPLTDPFFAHVFCPYMLRRWAAAERRGIRALLGQLAVPLLLPRPDLRGCLPNPTAWFPLSLQLTRLALTLLTPSLPPPCSQPRSCGGDSAVRRNGPSRGGRRALLRHSPTRHAPLSSRRRSPAGAAAVGPERTPLPPGCRRSGVLRVT